MVLIGDNMLNEEQFVDLIIDEYEDWCGYHGESYITNDKEDDDELFDFVMCNIKIDGVTIEELDDDAFDAWKKFFDSIDKSKIWDCVDEINHPYDPWTEHRADWYGF